MHLTGNAYASKVICIVSYQVQKSNPGQTDDGQIATISGTGSKTVPITVVTVGKLQYNDPLNGWTDVQQTLYVLRGTTVTFRAIPAPSSASFPNGYPVWGGTSGASGTGETIPVTFSTLSLSTNDVKTVEASCGGSGEAQVVVYDLIPHADPTDTTVPNHNTTHIGVGEVLNLFYTTSPTGLSASQVGTTTWYKDGDGTMVISQGNYSFRAAPIGGGVTLTVMISSGPSGGGSRSLSKLTIAPTLGYLVQLDGKTYHQINTASAAFYGHICISPNDVSFDNVQFRETDCTPSVATGSFSGFTYYYHMGHSFPTTSPWYSLAFNTKLNTWEAKAYDQVAFRLPPDTKKYPTTGYGSGKITFQIPWNFHVINGGSPDNTSLINSVLQTGITDSDGKMTTSKGAVSVSAKAADPYVGPFGDPPNTLW